MPEDPTPRQRKLAVTIFAIILLAGLGLTVFFLTDAADEVEEADPPEEEVQEPTGHLYDTPPQPLALSFSSALPASIS